jgi:hypothetical protein
MTYKFVEIGGRIINLSAIIAIGEIDEKGEAFIKILGGEHAGFKISAKQREKLKAFLGADLTPLDYD